MISMVGKLPRPIFGKIFMLEKKIKTAQKYHNYKDLPGLEQELAKESKEAKRDILRRLPLFFGTKVTDYKFVCSNCFDICYQNQRQKQNQRLN
jgi:hypothetical protein